MNGRMQTSTRATKEAIIMAKASPASNEGAPHWKGYGTLILQTHNSNKEHLMPSHNAKSWKSTLNYIKAKLSFNQTLHPLIPIRTQITQLIQWNVQGMNTVKTKFVIFI